MLELPRMGVPPLPDSVSVPFASEAVILPEALTWWLHQGSEPHRLPHSSPALD
jgi:hypothetical protein